MALLGAALRIYLWKLVVSGITLLDEAILSWFLLKRFHTGLCVCYYDVNDFVLSKAGDNYRLQK